MQLLTIPLPMPSQLPEQQKREMNSHPLQNSFCIMSLGMEYPFAPSQLPGPFAPSQLPGPFTENGSGSVQHCLAATINIDVLSTLFLPPRTKTQHHSRHFEENNSIPAETKTENNLICINFIALKTALSLSCFTTCLHIKIKFVVPENTLKYLTLYLAILVI